MKRIILTSFASLLLFTAVLSCSDESSVDLTNDTTPVRQNRSDAWNGVIGEDHGGGVYEITADKKSLLADLQSNVDKEGATTDLVTLSIVKKIALNDPGSEGYMLIAGDGRGLSVGVMLYKNDLGFFKLDNGFSNATPKSVSCWGCATGCNLEYLYVDGKKIPICNENGCVADCTKKETELN